MTTERLRVLFMNAARQVKTPEDMVEVLKTLPEGTEQQIGDFIIEVCIDKGIDPKAKELQEFYQQTAEYKAEQEKTEKLSRMSRFIGKIETMTKEFRENEKRGAIPTSEQTDTIIDDIKKQAANLGSIEGKRRIYTVSDYDYECLHYDPSKDFTPDLFGGLAFPDGTTSYIGARTARGKTTAMINLAREAMAADRKTIFITLEMSGKQLLNKLILSTAFASGITDDKANDPEIRLALMSMDASRAIYSVWQKKELAGNGTNIFRKYVQEAHEVIRNAHESGKFILYDGRNASELEIINFITANAEKRTVVLLDYIQKMPTKPGTDNDTYRRLQSISYDVVNVAAETNSIIVAGAQFNRTGGKDETGDIFTDQSFREAGDIEQDAHNAIGIGWKTDKQSRFYEILKTREDNKEGSAYDIEFYGKYSYMNQGGALDKPQDKPKGKGKQNKQNNKSTVLIFDGPI
jgi:hypothetical protein